MEEKVDNGFTGDMKIPREISGIKADIVAGLDLREIGYISIGLVLAIIAGVIVFGVFHNFSSFAVMIPAIIIAPFFAVAKVKKNGMNLEDWLVVWYSNNFKSRPVRTNEIINEYELLEETYQKKLAPKDKVSNKEKKMRKKELKSIKKNSPYRAYH